MLLKFELEGFNCAGCLPKIEKAIGNLDNVSECKINFASSTMEVSGTELSSELIIRTFLKFEPKVRIKLIEDNNQFLDTDKNKNKNEEKWTRIFISFAILLYFFTIFYKPNFSLFYFLLSYLIIGYRVLKTSIYNIRKGMLLDENFLMSIATIGAFAIGDYSEAVAVMLFYFIGETLQDYAVDKSRRSIKESMNIAPEYANLKESDKIIKVSPKIIKIGDIILIKPGERVPLDGIIKSGSSTLDTSALTGESEPINIKIGDKILSGSININGILEVEVTEVYINSTVSKILYFVEQASDKKATIEKFMTKFSKYYTPIVVLISALVFIVPGVYTGEFKTWFYRGLLLLVISCPCALVISIPLAIFSGIGKASSSGILIKGGNYLEVLGKIKAVVFDKTGTLTEGNFKVLSNSVPPEIGEIVAGIEANSTHPIAKSIVEYYKTAESIPLTNFKEESGMGIIATYNNNQYLIGNSKLLDIYKVSYPKNSKIGTTIFVVENDKLVGEITIGDSLKVGSKLLIAQLKNHGIKSFILSGDKKENVEAVAKELEIDGEVFSELLPGEKMKKYELIKKESNGYVAFMGDGINDAPVLRLSDVGISFGGVGSDAALEAADIVIMDNHIEKLSHGIDISKNVEKILYQNVIFSLSIKVVVMVLGVLGIASMWLAVFSDVGVALLAVLNAMRILRNKKELTDKNKK